MKPRGVQNAFGAAVGYDGEISEFCEFCEFGWAVGKCAQVAGAGAEVVMGRC